VGPEVSRREASAAGGPLVHGAHTFVVQAVGLVVDLVIRRKGYRMSEDDLLAIAEVREREAGTTPA